MCFIVLGVYQYHLTYENLTEFMLHADRSVSFFASNREGIMSLFGYTSIYLMAEWFSGRYLFNRPALSSSAPNGISGTSQSNSQCLEKTTIHQSTEHRQICGIMRALLIAASVCGGAWGLSATLLQPTSRRLANMPFVCMILCLSSLMLTALLLVDTIGKYFSVVLTPDGERGGGGEVASHHRPLTTIEIMSKHQLVVFMIANVLTGGVNMSMQTLYVTDARACLIVYCYMTVVVLLSWIFDKRRIIAQ